MKRVPIGLAGVGVVCVALYARWLLVPATTMPEDYVEMGEFDLRGHRGATPQERTSRPELAPRTERFVQPQDNRPTADELRRALVATPFPAGQTNVRIRMVELAVDVPPQPPPYCPPGFEAGDMRDGQRCPDPDDPVFVAYSDDEFHQWRDEWVQSLVDANFACGGARQEVICDDQACAWLMLDGGHDGLASLYRRPAQIPEKIGRWLGLPAEIDTCHTLAMRHQTAGVSSSHTNSLVEAHNCIWYAPRPAFRHHDNWVGIHHGEALCDVLVPPAPQ